VLDRLARRNLYAITSFIFGMDNDTPGVAQRTLEQIRSWPPGLPVFGLLTPFPSTPLYKRLETAGRLTRPKHWLDFAPFQMAHTPLKMSSSEVHREVALAWTASYSPERITEAIDSINYKPVESRIIHLIARFFFRGIYFPQMGWWDWMKVIAQNRQTIIRLVREAFGARKARKKEREKELTEETRTVTTKIT
jgi:hypothetical protein